MQGFMSAAKRSRILIKPYGNFEEGMTALEANLDRYDGVIFDAKGLKDDSQLRGTESFGNLFSAIDKIKSFKGSSNRHIPFCVYTGFFELTDQWLDKIDIFVKGQDQEKMFAYLHQEASQNHLTLTKRQYSAIFEFADKYFDTTNYSLLLALLNEKSLNSEDNAIKIDSITKLRRLNEKLMDIVCQQYLEKDINMVVKQGEEGGRTKTIFKELEQRLNVPVPIKNSIWNIYQTSSNYGNHTPLKSQEFLPSKFTVLSMTYGLLESMIWVKNIIQQN